MPSTEPLDERDKERKRFARTSSRHADEVARRVFQEYRY